MKTILVVENNVKIYENYISRILTAGLTKAGIEHTLVHYTNMAEAFTRMVDVNTYDAALVDYELGKAQEVAGPGTLKNGAALVTAVLKAAPGKPLFGMHNHPMARMFFLHAGATNSFEKPAVAAMVHALVVNLGQ